MRHVGWRPALAAVALMVATVAPAMAQSAAPSDGLPSAAPIDVVSVLVIQLEDPSGATVTPETQASALATITTRLDRLPGSAVTVTALPDERIRLDLGDPTLADTVARVATTPGELRFVGIPNERAGEVEDGLPLPEGMPVVEVVGPGHLIEVGVNEDQLGQPALDLTLDAEAADAFDAWAANHQGELFAMVLDGTVAVAATINAPAFHGRAQISGSFVRPQLEELAAILAGGPLPVRAQLLGVCPAQDACPVSSSPEASAAP